MGKVLVKVDKNGKPINPKNAVNAKYDKKTGKYIVKLDPNDPKNKEMFKNFHGAHKSNVQ